MALAAYDIYHLLRELQYLVGGKVNKIYQPAKEEVLMLLHVPSKGKQIVRITPSLFYVTGFKGEMPEPSGFCKFLRKRLHNIRLTKLYQYEFERVVVLEFGDQFLVVELFSHGNIVLCDGDLKIISLLRPVATQHRTLRGGVTYTFPSQSESHFLNCSHDDFLVEVAAKEESVVKVLAKRFGLGGVYAEELMARAKLPKDTDDVSACFDALKQFRELETDAVVYSGVVAPIQLVTKEGGKRYSSFNEALDEVYTAQSIEETHAEQTASAGKKQKKAMAMITAQLETLENTKEEIEVLNAKGNAVYEHYQELQALVEEMREIARKTSWKEMAEQFAKHKLVKKVDVEKKKVIVVV